MVVAPERQCFLVESEEREDHMDGITRVEGMRQVTNHLSGLGGLLEPSGQCEEAGGKNQ